MIYCTNTELEIDIVVQPNPRNRKQAIINVYRDSDCRFSLPIAAKGR